jgi:hypothetical protein
MHSARFLFKDAPCSYIMNRRFPEKIIPTSDFFGLVDLLEISRKENFSLKSKQAVLSLFIEI